MPVIKCQKHWFSYVSESLWFLLFLAGSVVLIRYKTGPGLIALAVVLALAVVSFFTIREEYIAVNPKEVIGHKGFINSRTLRSPLSKVQGVEIDNGIFGKMFGYHNIIVTTAGTSGAEYVFKMMKSAKQFQDSFIDFSNSPEVRQ